MNFHRLVPILAATAAFLAVAPMSIAQSNDDSKVVVGHVFEVQRKTKVLREPKANSRAWFSVDPEVRLCVRTDAPKGWAKVLLNNGSYGYITADAVKVILSDEGVPYEVSVPKQTYAAARRSPVQAVSRGTGTARAAAAETGLNFIGTPYKWGGNDIENGIDCSGFVQKLYGKFGVDLPRTAAQQALVGTPITRLENLQKGDRLYFWDTKRNMIGHTGLYLGDGKFVHSSSSRKGVQVDDLRDGKWLNMLVSARR